MPEKQYPRLSVVVPLFLVCFGVIFYWIHDTWIGPAPVNQSGEAKPPVSNSPAGRRERLDSPMDAPGDQIEESSPAVVRGRIVLNGTPPPETELPFDLDPTCRALRTDRPTTRRYVVGRNGQLADVFVYIKRGLQPRAFAPPSEPVVLDQVGCMYQPYVLGLQTKQKLLVRNSDPILHNVRTEPAVGGNPKTDRFQRAGAEDLEYIFDQPELLLRFRCGPHFWMIAFVCVVDHPFFAVSDRNGTFSISHVPAGSYVIEAVHRRAGRVSREVKVRPGEVITLGFVLEVPASGAGK